MSNTLIA